MHYQVDLDPEYGVIPTDVTAEIVTLGLAEDCYVRLSELSSSGGPYAAIYDLSATKDTTITIKLVTAFARRRPSIPPAGSPHVVVGSHVVMYGLARLLQICEESTAKEFEVVQIVEDTHKIVSARPEGFT